MKFSEKMLLLKQGATFADVKKMEEEEALEIAEGKKQAAILEAEADKEAGALYKQFFANATFEEAQTESLKSETGEVLSSVKALENGNQVGKSNKNA